MTATGQHQLTGQMPDVPGWASLMVVVPFLGGMNMLALGIVGQYIAKIHDEAKRRPVYVVRRELGFDSEHMHRAEHQYRAADFVGQ